MGYYVTLIETDFTVPTANIDEAYKRLIELNQNDALKRGGSWGRKRSEGEAITAANCTGDDPRPEGMNYHPARWFSWMGADYPSDCPDLASIFERLGFEVEQDDNGLHLLYYDSKTGQEDEFLAAICDLATGSCTWRGEDDLLWRDEYGGESVRHFSPKPTEWVES